MGCLLLFFCIMETVAHTDFEQCCQTSLQSTYPEIDGRFVREIECLDLLGCLLALFLSFFLLT